MGRGSNPEKSAAEVDSMQCFAKQSYLFSSLFTLHFSLKTTI